MKARLTRVVKPVEYKEFVSVSLLDDVSWRHLDAEASY